MGGGCPKLELDDSLVWLTGGCGGAEKELRGDEGEVACCAAVTLDEDDACDRFWTGGLCGGGAGASASPRLAASLVTLLTDCMTEAVRPPHSECELEVKSVKVRAYS